MQGLLQDLRYGMRVLRKQPGFTFIAALTLALGIGVNTAIFSAVSSLLLRQSPYASPEKLAIVFTGGKQRPRVYDDFSYMNYLDYRDRNQSFSRLIAYRMTSAAISNTSGGSDDRAEVVWGETVSGNYFDVLGVPPALGRGFRPELVKDAGLSPGDRRLSLRNLLIVAQLAVSVAVLVCAGLFLRSLRNAQTTDLGFNVENLVSMQLDPELLGYSVEESKRFYAELARRVASLPGVDSATVTQFVPLSDSGDSTGPLIKEGEAPPAPNQGLYVNYSSIGVRYFETMGTRLLLGRDFTEHDSADAPQVVIINQELARRLYGSAENALGKRFHLADASRPPFEIVGVAADGKYRNLYEDPRPYLFLAHQQRYYVSQATLMARAQSPAALQSVAERMRHEAQRLDARLPVFDLKMARQHMSWAYWGPQLGAGLSLVSGLLALALATMGLYGVMSYAVSRRTKEIGIRMALGAQPRDALRLIVRQGMLLVVIGLSCGVVAALALGRVLASLLLGVGGADPLTFAGVITLLALTALIACLIPALRAAKVDPMVALRFE